MLGWINDCIEKLVINRFGLEAWHIVKQKAGCQVPDGEFFKLDVYTDKSSLDLVIAASEVSGLSVDQVFEAFGEFFVHYIRDEGYDNLLCCQGSTLKDWMSNINAIHQHLQTTFPKKMTMPQFWCEDDAEESGALYLHYHSRRGNYLAPLAKGLVSEIASFQFGVPIDMTRIQTQGEQGAKFTSWRVTAADPDDQWKLANKEGSHNGVKNVPTELKCPFTGMTTMFPSELAPEDVPKFVELCDGNDDEGDDYNYESGSQASRPRPSCPMTTSGRSHNNMGRKTSAKVCPRSNMEEAPSCVSTESETSSSSVSPKTSIGVSATVTKKLFPYHVVVDSEFTIHQVGKDLPGVLRDTEANLVGNNIADVFVMTKPIGMEWEWQWIRKLGDQVFDLKPLANTAGISKRMRFKATVKHISNDPPLTMLVLTPDANNLEDLREMDLTLSDLPVHGAHRDAIFLREHLSSHMNNALKMEKLSRSLAREKALLESLLPEHAAAGLREGKTVEPMLHKNVTFFFSDIVGFTNICDKIYPWDVIGMLNRLYCAMDFLAGRFNLFKVETIGDAYVCCSGLPEADEDHAENVANFAVAVKHCVKQVLSPLDNSPIELRIGIHSGSCASGVVGTTNPRYCVFGDTVNTASRHESTGAPGRIHCSSATQQVLKKRSSAKFCIKERGMVEMKGKGKHITYWLDSTGYNKFVNRYALEKLEKEVEQLLENTNFGSKCPNENTNCSVERMDKDLSNNTSAANVQMRKIPRFQTQVSQNAASQREVPLNAASREPRIQPPSQRAYQVDSKSGGPVNYSQYLLQSSSHDDK